MIINLVNANVDIGIKKDQNKQFIMNSLQPYLVAPIASMLSNLNDTTFHHDACSNEMTLPNYARIHRTRGTT